jgi:hypothetical protein
MPTTSVSGFSRFQNGGSPAEGIAAAVHSRNIGTLPLTALTEIYTTFRVYEGPKSGHGATLPDRDRIAALPLRFI